MEKGTVKKRGDKWQVRFNYKEDNKWKTKTATCATEREGHALLRTMNYEYEDGISNSNPWFSTVKDEWLAEKRLSVRKNTIKTYTNGSLYVCEKLGKIRIKDIKRKDIVKLFERIREDEHEPHYYKGILNSIMIYAITCKYITSNPAHGLTVSRLKDKRKPVIINLAQRQALLKALEGTLYYYPIFIGLLTGLRNGELTGLRWKNVDLDNKCIHVCAQISEGEIVDQVKSKNSWRTIFLDEGTAALFQELKDSVYTTPTAVFLQHEQLYDGIAYQLGKFGMIPHDLRHNHATDLLGLMNPADAAKRLGHTTAEYIRTYAQPTDESQRKAIQNLPSLFGDALSNNLSNKDDSNVVELSVFRASRVSSE